jgi:uncharacterized protein (TIGR01777 family)
MSKKHILLTGGTGLLGKQLTDTLINKGHKVSHLVRHHGDDPRVRTYIWNVAKGKIDDTCIKGVDIIVHLAGAGIADKRWTERRKKELINSRTKSIGLIYKLLKSKTHQVSAVVSASGTGYYSDRGDELLIENSSAGNDFLAECCIKWEQAVDEGKSLGLRILKFRTGVVLSAKGGALPKLAGPIIFGVGAPLGDGNQWLSWIHEQDVIDLYVYGIEQAGLSGVYNMVAPKPVTNKQLTRAVAHKLHRLLWLPNIPALFLKLIFGKMSVIVLASTKVSAQKTEEAGFIFKYPDLKQALDEIYK